MSTLPTTSLGMLDGMKSRSVDQWYRFFVQYSPRLRALCQRKMPDRDLVEDVVQDVMVTVVERIDTFEHSGRKGAFRSWLLSILNSRRVDICRKWRIEFTEQDFSQLVDPFQPEGSEIKSERLGLAMAILSKTHGPRTVEAFQRYKCEGQSAAYVADVLKMSKPSDVRVAAARCIRKLRELLGDFFCDEWFGTSD